MHLTMQPKLKEHIFNWADDVEEDAGEGKKVLLDLPPPAVVYENNLKIVIEYKRNDDNHLVKVVRTYKIERCRVPKIIAVRKNWAKFGDSTNDGPGPNPATTVTTEDILMQFLSSKEEDNKVEGDSLDKLKSMGDKGVVKCRNCNGDHWTSKCPFKDTIIGGTIKPEDKKPLNAVSDGGPGMADKPTGSKYVPPSMRDGGSSKGHSMQMQQRDDSTAIRISNLSESTTDADLEELVKPFGVTQKRYLGMDKSTNVCKGFAYVHFRSRAEAARAIAGLNGHGYDHLILSVDWSKPPAQNN